MNVCLRFIATFLVLGLVSCGGGGGGGSSDYAGEWKYEGRVVSNDCNVSVNAYLATYLDVLQDGENIVVHSGQITLSGSTNDEDGFDVTANAAYENCEGGYAYVFRNASDGIADAGLGIGMRCPGTPLCTVVWAGSDNARRSSQKSSQGSRDGGMEIAALKSMHERLLPMKDSGAGYTSAEDAALEAVLNHFSVDD